MSRKKLKLDFSSLQASSVSLQQSSRALENAVDGLNEIIRKECPSSPEELRRFLNKCPQQSLEILLVARLGLEGVECLRNAMRLVPESFLDRRSQYVCAIVNKVAHKPMEVSECEAFMSVLSSKFGSYCKRDTVPDTFDEELWQLTKETGKGFTRFLAPPVTCCTNPECLHNRLTPANVTNVSVFDTTGAHPASKLSLQCRQCGCMYNYSMFGKKFSSGEQYYNYTREFVEASDVVFMSRHLYDLFTSLRCACYYTLQV